MRVQVMSGLMASAISLCASAALAQQTTTRVDPADLSWKDVANTLLDNYAQGQGQRLLPAMAPAARPAPTSGVLQGQVTRDDMRLPRKPLFQDPSFFSDTPGTSPYPGSVMGNAPLQGQATQTPRGNHTWMQSKDGGYFDGTGAIQGVIPGDQLYKYGGKLQDGTPIPPYPVVTNFAKHVYRPFVRKQ